MKSPPELGNKVLDINLTISDELTGAATQATAH